MKVDDESTHEIDKTYNDNQEETIDQTAAFDEELRKIEIDNQTYSRHYISLESAYWDI